MIAVTIICIDANLIFAPQAMIAIAGLHRPAKLTSREIKIESIARHRR